MTEANIVPPYDRAIIYFDQIRSAPTAPWKKVNKVMIARRPFEIPSYNPWHYILAHAMPWRHVKAEIVRGAGGKPFVNLMARYVTSVKDSNGVFDHFFIMADGRAIGLHYKDVPDPLDRNEVCETSTMYEQNATYMISAEVDVAPRPIPPGDWFLPRIVETPVYHYGPEDKTYAHPMVYKVEVLMLNAHRCHIDMIGNAHEALT